MSSTKLSDLSVGDVVEVKDVVRVLAVGKDSARVADVKNGYVFGVSVEDDSTTKLRLLVKAPKPRPKVGDVIDAATVRATPWKRGTVIVGLRHVFMLTSKGDWFSPGKDDTEEDLNVPFGLLTGQFQVLHLP